MPTIDELILSLEVEREQNQKRRERSMAEITGILAKLKNEGRSQMTEDEARDVEAAKQRIEQCHADAEGIKLRLDTARGVKSEEERADELARTKREDPATIASRKAAYDQVARIGAEKRTYHQGNCRDGALFLRDVVRVWTHRDMEAESRLTQHMREERVDRGGKLVERADAGTGAFTGLVVPQYLTDMYAPKTAAMRPFADVCNKHDLPADGMSVNISRITTGSSVALQANEFDEASSTAMDDTLLTENVQTAAGYQDLSRQAIDRGTGIEGVVMDDLFRRYASTLDSTLLNQATTGLSAVAQSTTTDTTTTFKFVYGKLHGALSNAESTFLGFATPDIVVMHPRRWHWLNSQFTGSDGWPSVSQPGVPTQAWAVNLAQEYGKGARGILPNGLVVIADANVATNLGGGTNQDEIYVIASDECHLWEDPSAPVFVRAEQPRAKNLAVTLVLYGYFAYSFRRYTNGMQKLAGTSLVTPTF